jgi:hypothetical protein
MGSDAGAAVLRQAVLTVFALIILIDVQRTE